MTGSVTRPAKGYPLLVVKVARVVCSFILTAVPAGRDRFVCANPVNANRVVYASTASFRIVGPPNLMSFNLLGLAGRGFLLAAFLPVEQPARWERDPLIAAVDKSDHDIAAG